METLIRLYATGHIDFEGGDLIDFSEALKVRQSNRERLKKISKPMIVKRILPFLFAKTNVADLSQGFQDDTVGRDESKRNNRDYIQFHYDVSNEFYKLFLGSEMMYTCAYFKDWSNTLDQAQHDDRHHCKRERAGDIHRPELTTSDPVSSGFLPRSSCDRRHR